MPQDFRMASLYGIPDGSGLADWPISYEELAPDYDRAEQEIGVCGDASRMTLHGNRERPYPMPPMTPNRHPETLRTSDFMAEKAAQWLREAGAREVWTSKPGLHLSGGQHQAGTARMGHDPKTSVTDPFGRVHGHDNLFIADGSLHVTNGGFNPVLTIMALGYRVGRRVAETI
jgi:choline dehydrogenase-like flavoprotein